MLLNSAQNGLLNSCIEQSASESILFSETKAGFLPFNTGILYLQSGIANVNFNLKVDQVSNIVYLLARETQCELSTA